MTLQDQIDNAPDGNFKYTTIGQMHFEIERYTWNGKGVSPTKEPLADDMEVGPGQDMFITFTINTADVRDSSYPESRRNVKIVSGATSWAETVHPSLIAVFGKDWLKSAEGSYVAFQDVDNSEGREKVDGSLWGVPRFTAKYANLAEATQADADLRNGGNATSTVVDLSQAVETAKQLMTALSTTDRGKVFAQMKDTGELETFTPEQINDIFTQAGL